jgi:hypothetical protein
VPSLIIELHPLAGHISRPDGFLGPDPETIRARLAASMHLF